MPVELPLDVSQFLASAAPLRTRALGINPLSSEQAAAQSEQIQDIPIAAELGLVVLDDANDSNPYCLVTRGPASGMVLQLSHSSTPMLAFPDLTTFLNVLVDAVRDEQHIDDIKHHGVAALDEQQTLRATLQALLVRQDDDAPTLLAILFPLLDPTDVETVTLTASDDYFLVREVAARFIEANAIAVYRELAEVLSGDPYGQVARPARRALDQMRS